jgi:hypothetical protein
MKNTIATILLVLGIGTVIYGLVRKDEQQASIGIGDAEIQVGKADSAFSGYFIIGGIMAVAGIVIMVAGKKS